MNNLATRDKVKTEVKTRAKVLVETLCELGVESIFGYPGASVLSVYHELSNQKIIKHYLVRHEQAAMHAAEGYARTSGKVGVVLVTSGPGFTNTITGIANANADSTPLVVLAGDVSSDTKVGKIFQNIDIQGLTKSCAKKTYILSQKDDVRKIVKEAFFVANSGVKGAVVVVMPRNVLEGLNAENFSQNIKLEPVKKNFTGDFIKFDELLKNSSRPLILVGGGAINAPEEIKHFADKYSLPVISTLMGIGIYPSESENYYGMIGINGADLANAVLNQCDLLICFGVAFSDRSTCKNPDFTKKTKIISVNLEKISDDFELEILSDVKLFLMEYNRLNSNGFCRQNWLDKINLLSHEFKMENKPSKSLHSSSVLAVLSEYTKNYDTIVVTDVGQHQMLTAQHFKFNKPRKFITSGGLGTMGFGLPASIGAFIANPDCLVLNITGDGSFQMNLQELATCREHNIPIKIIIMNNGYLGMVRQAQEKLYNRRYQVEMTNPDFTKIAEAYDLFAVRVKTIEELIPAIQKAISHNGTAIVDVMIDSFENI